MRKLLCTLALIAVPVPATADALPFAESPAKSPAATAPEQDAKPTARVVSRAMVTFPEVAIKKGIEGHVVVRYSVQADGTVGDAQVVESVPPGVFDRSAIDAIRRFEFEPAKVEGKPVAAEGMQQRFSFVITNPSERPPL